MQWHPRTVSEQGGLSAPSPSAIAPAAAAMQMEQHKTSKIHTIHISNISL